MGYTKITVERPQMEKGKAVKDKKENLKPNTSLRDYEKISLKNDIDKYFKIRAGNRRAFSSNRKN